MSKHKCAPGAHAYQENRTGTGIWCANCGDVQMFGDGHIPCTLSHYICTRPHYWVSGTTSIPMWGSGHIDSTWTTSDGLLGDGTSS